VEFLVLQDAWARYPPAPISSRGVQYDPPLENPVILAAENSMIRYISAEFGPKIQNIVNRMRETGPTAALYNQLGVVYVRAGMLAEAKTQFERSVQMNSAGGMVNLGNLALMDRDLDLAEQWFNRALRIEPANRAALNGLNQVNTSRLE
jgi:tetratricopeptide (TPR) repeat protein